MFVVKYFRGAGKPQKSNVKIFVYNKHFMHLIFTGNPQKYFNIKNSTQKNLTLTFSKFTVFWFTKFMALVILDTEFLSKTNVIQNNLWYGPVVFFLLYVALSDSRLSSFVTVTCRKCDQSFYLLTKRPDKQKSSIHQLIVVTGEDPRDLTKCHMNVASGRATKTSTNPPLLMLEVSSKKSNSYPIIALQY